MCPYFISQRFDKDMDADLWCWGRGTLIKNPGAIRVWLVPPNSWSPHGCAAPSGSSREGISAPQPPLASPPVIPCQSRAGVGVFYSILVSQMYRLTIFLLALSWMKQLFGRAGSGEGWQDKESWHRFGNFIVTLQSCLSLVEAPQSFHLCCQK